MINSTRLLKPLLLAFSAALIALPAFAQEDPGLDEAPPAEESAAPPADSKEKPLNGTPVATDKSGKPKRTTIDFEDELVEGKTKNPELFYLLQKRQFNYKRLIRLRENFLPEMRKTSEDMQRKGSGD